MLPARGLETLGEDLQEAAVGIHHGEADSGLTGSRHRAISIRSDADGDGRPSDPGNTMVTTG
jgi:hypothetical protein